MTINGHDIKKTHILFISNMHETQTKVNSFEDYDEYHITLHPRFKSGKVNTFSTGIFIALFFKLTQTI